MVVKTMVSEALLISFGTLRKFLALAVLQFPHWVR